MTNLPAKPSSGEGVTPPSNQQGEDMYKDVAVYTGGALLFWVIGAPLWVLAIPAACAVSALLRHRYGKRAA